MPVTSDSSANGAAPTSVLIAGASGLIGGELVKQLTANGFAVTRLVRRTPRGADERQWDPASGTLDPSVMDGVDAVINLSGASIARIPWTKKYKQTILDSRLQVTSALVGAMNRAATPPTAFLSGSAVGIYGDQPSARLADGAPEGTGFLADVVRQWEAAAAERPAATRLVTLRTGLVIANGGALKQLILPTKLGLAVRVGTGGQYWPWISLHDEAAAIRHLVASRVEGPVNLAGPDPATSDRATAYLAKKLHRPYNFVFPERIVSLVMGEAGRELLLSSQKMVPTTLLADGFTFRHETVEQAIDAVFEGDGAAKK
ncbi:TIGR01777 family oxidoreductase [Marisediminicola senii]|uniref:TIGR01777 family oxidoreductase n=1 Tax=Marisediminicola senii TaxID=2711233 RepID=UPI0013EA3228|nr:TIGR01777 family oxidoreductase [Marisediminicola senii]